MQPLAILSSLLLFLRVCSGAFNVCTANVTEPGLNGNESNIVLLYTRVANDSRTCNHFVWATKGHNGTGFPTLFLAQTQNHTEACTQHCSEFVNESSMDVVIPGAVESFFSIGIVFTRLVEFVVDVKDAKAIGGFNYTCGCGTGSECDQNYQSFFLNDTGMQWVYNSDLETFNGTLKDKENSTVSSTFEINIKVQFPTSIEDIRLPYFPKTRLTANSSTMDILVQNFAYNLTSNITDPDTKFASRLALETFIVHGPNTVNGSVISVRTIDDEHTPSVFSTNTYTLPSDSKSLNGFLQWKPISYQDDNRRSTSSQQVNVFYTSEYSVCDSNSVPSGLASKLFKDGQFSNVTRWFLVFGTPGDDTWFNTEYLTWTSVAGYGRVPTDDISSVVIITIIVGLGIPAALIVLGSVYMFIRKKPWQNVSRCVSGSGATGTYTKIN